MAQPSSGRFDATGHIKNAEYVAAQGMTLHDTAIKT